MSKIALEGKNRLPGRVQDIILDVGMTVTHVQHGSSSNETLASIAKNYVSLETCVDNTAKSLEKMKSEIEKLEKNASFIEKSIEHITDAQHKLLTMELKNYNCTQD